MYIVIGKTNCIQCDNLKAQMNFKNISYTYIDQRYVHSDILDQCGQTCRFYPFVLKIEAADKFDDLLKKITG